MYSFTVPGNPVIVAGKRKGYIKKVVRCIGKSDIPSITEDIELTVKVCQGARCENNLDDILNIIEECLVVGKVIKGKEQVVGYGVDSWFVLGFKEPKVDVKIRLMET